MLGVNREYINKSSEFPDAFVGYFTILQNARPNHQEDGLEFMVVSCKHKVTGIRRSSLPSFAAG
jgi:hypothetical protein